MTVVGIDREMMKTIGIGGLLSKERFEKKAKEHLENTGKVEYAKELLKNDLGNELQREIQLENGMSTTFDEVMESYGLSIIYKNSPVEPASPTFLMANKKRVGVFKGDGKLYPVPGKERDYKKSLKKISKIREDFGLGGKESPFNKKLEKSGLEEHRPVVISLEEREKNKLERIEAYLSRELSKVEVEEKQGFLGRTNYELVNFSYKIFDDLLEGKAEISGNVIEGVGTDNVYSVLKSMEKDESYSKPVIKAAKKRFEGEEKIHRKRNIILGGTLVGLTAALVAGTAYSLSQNSNNILHSKDPVVADEVKRNVMNDPNIKGDKNALLNEVSQQFLNLGLYGNVSVLDPKTNTYKQQAVTPQTVQAVSNATVAAVIRDLPNLSRNAYFKLGNASQINPEIGNFSKVVVPGKHEIDKWTPKDSDLWKDSNKIDLGYYTLAMDLEQSPYVLNNPESFEFFNGLLRQHNLVLNAVGLNPADNATRSTYVKPDIDYYYKTLPKISIEKGMPLPLLPLLNSTKMKQWFPDKTDRAVIYASQYPIQMAYFNAKTGKVNYGPINYQPQTLLDNLDIIWNGLKWGNFEGKLAERVLKAYSDKSFISFPSEHKNLYRDGWSDNQLARDYYSNYHVATHAFNDIPGGEDAIRNFVKNADPKLATHLVTDLGYRFITGLSIVDTQPFDEPHQYAPHRASLYAKALGGSSIGIGTKIPSLENTYHEASAAPVPKYIADQLPTLRYGPGKMVQRGSMVDNSIELIIGLPNGDSILY
jgi:hypothetical protein